MAKDEQLTWFRSTRVPNLALERHDNGINETHRRFSFFFTFKHIKYIYSDAKNQLQYCSFFKSKIVIPYLT